MALFGSGRPNVKRLQRKKKVDRLRDAAAYTDFFVDQSGDYVDAGPSVRVEALRALAEFEGPAVDDAVRTGVVDENPEVRAAAAELARDAGATGTADVLIAGLASWPEPPYDQAREAAAAALMTWGSPDFAQRFALALTTETDRELSRDLDEPLLRALHADRDWTALVQTLTQRLADPDLAGEARERAGEVLRWVGGDAALSVVVLLRERDPDLRIIELAGHLLNNELLPDLVLLCQHHDPSRRAAAAGAVGAIQDTRGVAALLRLTQDEAHAVRRAALAALDQFGVSGVVFGIAAGAGSAAIEGGAPQAVIGAGLGSGQPSPPADES